MFTPGADNLTLKTFPAFGGASEKYPSRSVFVEARTILQSALHSSTVIPFAAGNDSPKSACPLRVRLLTTPLCSMMTCALPATAQNKKTVPTTIDFTTLFVERCRKCL
jgi:hypothetical protein